MSKHHRPKGDPKAIAAWRLEQEHRHAERRQHAAAKPRPIPYRRHRRSHVDSTFMRRYGGPCAECGVARDYHDLTPTDHSFQREGGS